MAYKVSSLYEKSRVQGPHEAIFTEVVVGGGKASNLSLFLHLENTYLAKASNMQNAYKSGCRIFVASYFPHELLQDQENTLIRVESPLEALYYLAGVFRREASAQIIAVTGSSGKTTCKDMIAHLLRQHSQKTLKTYKNYNGLLGVALTMRKLRCDHDYAVIEVGMGEPGSLAIAARLTRPHISVITNIGMSHIAKYGTTENIAREKGALLTETLPGGIRILNGDDPPCRALGATTTEKVFSFGLSVENDLIAEAFEQSMHGITFSVRYKDQKVKFSLPLYGQFQLYNVLAALSVGLYYGFDLSKMAERMRSFRPAEQRLRPISLRGVLILDDGYNSNAISLTAALATLTGLPLHEEQKIAVIGDMQELGIHTEKYYAELSLTLSTTKLAQIILVGPLVAPLASVLPHACTASTPAEVVEQLKKHVATGSAILLKGQDDRLFTHIREEIIKWLHEKVH